jgi:hypothetical protein
MSALSRRSLKTLVAAGLALGLSFGGFAATAAPAYAETPSQAVLAAPLAEPRSEIIAGALWKCAADRCSAAVQGSRPVLQCARVARTFGPVSRYSTPKGTLSAEDLARCNTG